MPREHAINTSCPSCGQPMSPCVLECSACELRLEGDFRQNEFSTLEDEYLHLLRIFVTCEGRIREMEAALGVSYPTVKARIAELKARVGLDGEMASPNASPAAGQTKTRPRATEDMDVLNALDSGDLDYEEALRLLKGEPPKEA
ncbi:MAG: DUF2089 family protein [Pseudomonadales bacterium]